MDERLEREGREREKEKGEKEKKGRRVKKERRERINEFANMLLQLYKNSVSEVSL